MTTQYIDLFPAGLRRRSQPLSASLLALVCLALVAMLGAWTLVARSQAQSLSQQAVQLESRLKAEREQVAALGKELAARKGDPVLAAEVAGAEALLAARHEAIAVLEQGRLGNASGFSDYLRAFSRQTVQGLWLTGFDISGGGSDMSLAGRAIDAELLPRYVRRLNAEEIFRGRSFATLNMKAAEPGSPAVGDDKGKATAAPQHYVEFRLASSDAAPAGGNP